MKWAVVALGVLLAGCPASKPDAVVDAATDAAPSSPEDASAEGGVLNVTPLPTAAVAQMVNPQNLPAYSGPTGSVEGMIYVTGEPPRPTDSDFKKCPEARALYGHAFREGPMAASADKAKRPLVDAIVGVTGYPGFVPEKNDAEQVVIEGCGYTKRTVTMTFGQRLEVKNQSKEFWTPMLEPDPNLVMMMAPPNGGDPAKIYPKKPGHYLVLDHDRKYVSVDLYVFLFPLHTSSDQLGHYRIDGVPANVKVKLSARHPQIDAEQEQEITVENGVVKTFDFVLKNTPREAGAPDGGGGAPGLH